MERRVSAVIAASFACLHIVGFCGAIQAQVVGHRLPQVRKYFIGADEVQWNYTPRGRNLAGLPDLEGAENASTQGSRRYLKAIYREYTDAAFKTLKERPPRVAASGNPGTADPRRSRRNRQRGLHKQYEDLLHHAPAWARG